MYSVPRSVPELAPITVAIATFNRAAFLVEALKSCREQAIRPERVIVVDDGSSDDTARVVNEFRGVDTTYINVGKIGLGNARNLATALCSTRYICVLDDDDIMLPNRLSDHLASFRDGAQLSHGGWINFNEHLELEYRPGKRVDEDLIVYVGAAITHGACCYETAVLREFPYRTDTAGGADFDLAVRAIRSGIRCEHTGSYVLLRRRHAASVSAIHGRGQATMREALVGAINLGRSDSEIARRTTSGSCYIELVDSASPPLESVYSLLGGLRGAMRVSAAVPRAANKLFPLLDKLRLDWSQIELLDGETSLTSTIRLTCRPTRKMATLATFEAALRQHSIKPSLVMADGGIPGPAGADLGIGCTPGTFRLALRSSSLRELYLAHRIISSQRGWEWFVAMRAQTIKNRTRPVYWLVSASMRKALTAAEQQVRSRELQQFIQQQTDVFALVIDSEPEP